MRSHLKQVLFSCIVLLLVPLATFSQNHLRQIDFDKLVIQFEDASAEIVPEYIPLLYRLADTLNRNKDIQVLIRGHVCCVNRNGLAKKRAKAVRYYLVLFGVESKRLKVKGMKNSMPVITPERTKEDELANMRVDFIFTATKEN